VLCSAFKRDWRASHCPCSTPESQTEFRSARNCTFRLPVRSGLETFTESWWNMQTPCVLGIAVPHIGVRRSRGRARRSQRSRSRPRPLPGPPWCLSRPSWPCTRHAGSSVARISTTRTHLSGPVAPDLVGRAHGARLAGPRDRVRCERTCLPTAAIYPGGLELSVLVVYVAAVGNPESGSSLEWRSSCGSSPVA
jgi:hypothetical protein